VYVQTVHICDKTHHHHGGAACIVCGFLQNLSTLHIYIYIYTGTSYTISNFLVFSLGPNPVVVYMYIYMVSQYNAKSMLAQIVIYFGRF